MKKKIPGNEPEKAITIASRLTSYQGLWDYFAKSFLCASKTFAFVVWKKFFQDPIWAKLQEMDEYKARVQS